MDNEIVLTDKVEHLIANGLLIGSRMERISDIYPAPNHITAQIGEPVTYFAAFNRDGADDKIACGARLSMKAETSRFVCE